MNDSRTDSNKTLQISLSSIMGVLVLVLTGALIYILLFSGTGNPDLLDGRYELNGPPPEAPEGWVTTSSRHFYIEHPPGISPSKITGQDRRILGGILHDKGTIDKAIQFSNDNTELFDVVVGKTEDLNADEFKQAIIEFEKSSARDSSFDHRIDRIEQGDREMIRVETRNESELSNTEVWSVNQSGDFLWVQTTSSIGTGVDWMLTPQQAENIISTVRGP